MPERSHRLFLAALLQAGALCLPAAGQTPGPTPAPAPGLVPGPAESFLAYSGTATARHAPQFLYGERHVLAYRGGRLAERVVLYTCKDGAPFARKLVAYGEQTAPDFVLEDLSNGLREGVRTDAGGRRVFFRQSLNDQEKSAPLPPAPGMVIDAGFDEFVRLNWSRLLAGESLKMHFLVPSRLESIDFQVRHLRAETVDGLPAQTFRLALSGFWGWMLPGIDVSYRASDPVLLRYDGLSDLRSAAGDNYAVLIHFPAKDRVPGTAAAFQAARTARLTPCR